jgi:hypothetical protein
VFTDDVDLGKNVRLNGSKLITELLKQTVTFEIHVAVGVKITASSYVKPHSFGRRIPALDKPVCS